MCIEPWYGISDFEDCTGKLEDKKGILKLEKDKTFTAKLVIKGIL
ncbi:hypothetical protein [Leptotrichia sp. oral taxon 847]|nr:hypothetical protein [Leptotrichia sp. oral taxon 847]